MNAVYFIKRFLYSFVTIWAIVTVTFVLFRMLPGDPAAMMIDPLMDPARREVLMERFGLNEPFYVQYFDYFRLLLAGELGTSYQSRQPVTTLLNSAFVHSFVLATVMFILAYGVGSVMGALLAWYRGTLFERVGVNMALLLRGAPPFFVGILLIMVFAINLGWLPGAGIRTGFAHTSVWRIYGSWDFIRHLILPALTGAIFAGSSPMLIMRSAMLDVTQAEFLDLARAKGLSGMSVLFRHAFRNALLPLIAEGSQFFAYAIGGLVTIEVVFSWPGLGRTIVQALLFRDFPVAQGAFLYIGLLVVVSFVLSDALAAYFDPRARRVERVAT
jgi:peptide/nickel transport system permease protein